MRTHEPILAVGAAVVLVGSIVWLVLARPAPIVVPATTRPGGALALASLHPPAIGAFEQYDVNGDNPFVPYQDRSGPAGGPAAKPGWIPPQPPTKVPEPVAPPLQYPVVPAGGGDAPLVNGFVRGGDGAAGLHVVLPGGPPCHMRVGERIGRWTLHEIDAGSVAVFTDETGRRYRLPIGTR